jgi:hypothetical protein
MFDAWRRNAFVECLGAISGAFGSVLFPAGCRLHGGFRFVTTVSRRFRKRSREAAIFADYPERFNCAQFCF